MQGMPVTTQTPLEDHASELADLHVRCWQQSYRDFLPTDFFTEDFHRGREQMWRQVLSEPSAGMRARIALVAGEIVGFALVGNAQRPGGQLVPRDRQLYMLYVDQAFHGQGIGQRLLAETLGDEPALLWVALGNDRAVRFYERQGFQFDGSQQISRATPKLREARMIR